MDERKGQSAWHELRGMLLVKTFKRLSPPPSPRNVNLRPLIRNPDYDTKCHTTSSHGPGTTAERDLGLRLLLFSSILRSASRSSQILDKSVDFENWRTVSEIFFLWFYKCFYIYRCASWVQIPSKLDQSARVLAHGQTSRIMLTPLTPLHLTDTTRGFGHFAARNSQGLALQNAESMDD